MKFSGYVRKKKELGVVLKITACSQSTSRSCNCKGIYDFYHFEKWHYKIFFFFEIEDFKLIS
jgi:hypothetical protein